MPSRERILFCDSTRTDISVPIPAKKPIDAIRACLRHIERPAKLVSLLWGDQVRQVVSQPSPHSIPNTKTAIPPI